MQSACNGTEQKGGIMAQSHDDKYLDKAGVEGVWNKITSLLESVVETLTSLINGKRDLFSLTDSWIGRNLAGTTYGVACRFKITSVSEPRTIYMRINTRGVIHNLRILASSSGLSIGDRQAGTDAKDDGIYGHIDTTTGIVTIYLKMRDYREGASVTEFNPARYYYYNNRLTDVTFPNKEYVSALPDGYVTAVQDGWARYDRYGNDISTYYQPVITAGTGLSKSDNTINHANSVTAKTSDLGSYARIPVIRYDGQGHITKGDYVSIFNSERTSTIKVGYIHSGSQSSNVGWFKVGEATYWNGSYNRFSFLISVLGTNANSHDYGLLRVRGVSASTAGFISGLTAQWIVKTPSNGSYFTSDCIRLVKSDTSTSSGATLSVYMRLPVVNLTYNFMMLNEANAGGSIKAFQFEFSNSTTKESVEPAPTYASSMAPLELGNQSNCLEITNDNWQSYMTASNESSSFSSCDILTIPEGTTSIFFSTQQTASIACIRGKETLGRFPRNGVRITIAGNWKPQENGGYAGGNAEGRFSQYLYTYRAGVSGSYKDSRMDDAFEDFLYFNGVWYSKGY